jgi:hypothetical protein
MSEETEFQYVLKQPFSYASHGEQVDAKFIAFTAPTSKTSRECAALKQSFFRAMSERNEAGGQTVSTATEVETEIESADVIALLAMSKDVDLPEVMDIAKRLFQMPGIALVDGETKFGTSLVDKVSIDDFEDMIGEYMVNFILASSLKRLKDKSSKESQA